MSSREVTCRSIPLRKTRPIWWAIFPMCTSQCFTFGAIFSATVCCPGSWAALLLWPHRRDEDSSGGGERGLSMVCITQKSWESPTDVGQGGQVRTKWSVVGSTQMRKKGHILEIWVCPAYLETFLEDHSTVGGVLWSWTLSVWLEGIWWELRAVDIFWYTNATSSYQPGVCNHGGVTALNTSYEPVQASSPRAVAGKGVCSTAVLSVEHKGPWAVTELGTCFGEDADATVVTACLFTLDPPNFSGRNQIS